MHIAQSNIYLCSVAKDASFMIVAPYVLCAYIFHYNCSFIQHCTSCMYAQVVMWFDHEPVPIFPTQGGVNAFHACIANGHLVVAKYLAPKMEGHLFDPDDSGYTTLHWAAQKCQYPMVECLMRSCRFNVKVRDKVGHES